MNFTEAVAEVVSITKRPDKLADIQREVNAAINFCCIEGNFARDLQEDSYVVDNTLYAQSLPLSTFTRWRKFAYIKPPACKGYVEQRDPSRIFENHKEAADVYYVVGDEVKFKLCKLTATLLIGHFRYPPTLTDIAPTFWLLDVSPYMIIAKAAGAIFSDVGNTTEAASHLGTFNTLFSSAQRDYKYGANYG